MSSRRILYEEPHKEIFMSSTRTLLCHAPKKDMYHEPHKVKMFHKNGMRPLIREKKK